jgi:hypothetical protein
VTGISFETIKEAVYGVSEYEDGLFSLPEILTILDEFIEL